MFPHSLPSTVTVRDQLSGSPGGEDSPGAGAARPPRHCPTPASFTRVASRGLDKARTGCFPLLTCGHAQQEAEGEDRPFSGDSEAASLGHLGGDRLAAVGERVTAWLLCSGLAAGTGSQGINWAQLLQGL